MPRRHTEQNICFILHIHRELMLILNNKEFKKHINTFAGALHGFVATK